MNKKSSKNSTKSEYNKILPSVVLASLLLTNLAIADQTVDSASTSTLTSDGSENIIVEVSISTTNDNDINITGSLQSGYHIHNYGDLNSTDGNGIEVYENNIGTIDNFHKINTTNGSGISVVGTNSNIIQNDADINASIGIKVGINGNNGYVLNYNNSNIDSNLSSIVANENDGTIGNYGQLKSTNGSGIEVDGNNTGYISNNNSITALNGSGIKVAGASSSIGNYGDINASIGIQIGINNSNGFVYNGYNYGDYINNTIDSNLSSIIVDENDGNITNYGKLNSANGEGIKVGSNYGSILNDTTGSIDSNLNSIYIQQDNEGNITNRGTLSSSNGDGIFIEGNNTGIILNDTDANITSSAASIRVGTNKNEIINKGSIKSLTSFGIVVFENNATILNDTDANINTLNHSSIYVVNNNSNITNKGSIKSLTSDGIEVDGDNNATILNEKGATIDSLHSAIAVRNNESNGYIINRGLLLSSMRVSTNNGTILNDITGSVDSNGSAISVNDTNGTIINNGYLKSLSGNGIEISFLNFKTVTNNGSIETSTENGIYINGGNRGTITNNGSIKSFDANGIEVESFNQGILLNDTNGVITSKYASIFVNENDGNITNKGTLISTDGNGIDNDLGSNNGIILNDTTGTITAKNAGIYIGGTFAGTIINNGTITANYSLMTNSDANGTFTNNGIAAGNIDAKSVDVYNNGVVKLSPTNRVVSKTYTQDVNGVLDIGVDINSTTLVARSAMIETSGNIAFKDGSTINVDFTNTTDTTIGNWFDSLSDSTAKIGYKDFNTTQGLIATTAEGNITADTDSLQFIDNSTLLAFSADNNGTDMNLVVRKAGGGLEELVDKEGYSFEYGAAKALDTIFAGSNINADIDTFLTALDSKSTDEQKAEALATATPLSTFSSTSAIFQSGNIISGIISARGSSTRGLNSGDKTFTDRNLWIRPYSSYSSQDNKDDNKGFSARTKGFVIGVDGMYSDAKRFGLAFAYGSSSVDTNDLPQSSDIDSFSLTAYGSRPIIDSKTDISYQVGFGLQKVDSDRYIDSTAQTASASYNSKLYYAQVVVNRSMNVGSNVSFTPMLKLRYRLFQNPSYSESDAGGMDLNVESYDTTEMLLGTGGTIAYAMNQATNIEVFANVNYDFCNDAQTISSSFQGASNIVFQTTGIENSPYTFGTGLSVTRKLPNNSSIGVGGSLDKKSSGFSTYSLFAKYNVKF